LHREEITHGKTPSYALVLGMLMPSRPPCGRCAGDCILRSGDRVMGDLVDLTSGGFVVGSVAPSSRSPGRGAAIASRTLSPGRGNRQDPDGRTSSCCRTARRSTAAWPTSRHQPLTPLVPHAGRDRTSARTRSPASTSPRCRACRVGRGHDAAGGAPGLDQGGAGMTVPANPCWTNTQRSVRQGQRSTFNGHR